MFRRLHLTRELIAAAHPHPVADDHGAMRLLSDAELAAFYEATMAHATEHRELWVFGYGSLMWHPELDHDGEQLAVVHGWHRRFCLWQWRYRATRERPGLMLALDRGGACKGVAFRVTGGDLRTRLARVWEREMRADGYRPRWVRAHTAQGVVPALTFVANCGGERYAGALALETVAATIARACGHKGAAAEYLLETVQRCEQLGIRDAYLWRLQRLVAGFLTPENPVK